MRQFKPGQLQTGSLYPISASYALTASYLSGSISIDAGSLLTTASFSNPNLEFEKGNGSGFTLNLSSLTVTSSLTASFINGGTF